jgi:hypothetical protein
MLSRFFTLGISLGLITAAMSGLAQSPAPKLGYIRFWDMLPAQNGTFELRKADGSSAEGNLLTASAYRYSGYGEFPVGRHRIGVFKKGVTSPLKVFDVDLKPDVFFTILVSPLSIDMIDDTNDPKATSGTLTVRNYFPGVTVEITANAQKIVTALPYGQSHTAGGLPLQRLPLSLHARLPNGTPIESGAEADLRASKRATLLIIPDSYGRISPRIALDGKNL